MYANAPDLGAYVTRKPKGDSRLTESQLLSPQMEIPEGSDTGTTHDRRFSHGQTVPPARGSSIPSLLFLLATRGSVQFGIPSYAQSWCPAARS